MQYAELVCQSNFSFLKGASSPEELIAQANQYGYRAIAITDECSVSGIVKAYAHKKRFNLKHIKLIVGSKFVFEGVKLVLICPTRLAYAELCRVITNARRRCEKGKYQLSKWDLTSVQHCFVIWLPSGDKDKDEENGQWLKTLYQNRLRIGMRRHLTANEVSYLRQCEILSRKLDIKILACADALMHCKTRLPLQQTLSAIQQKTQIDKLGKQTLGNAERSLRDLTTLNKLFPPEYLNNAVKLADECSFDLSELKYEYPSELIPKGSTPSKYLRHLVNKGKKLRFGGKVPDKIAAIIDKELNLIEEMAYEHFFITIYDIVQFAKKQHILYQGRGSAANSIVCYCLEITSVNPDKIQVLFERFISKERKEPPDIDVDFEHQRREEIFQYIYKKYGHQHTAITATVVTYRLKSAIREVGKALGINETQLEFFIKNINRRDRKTEWYEQIAELGLSDKSYKAQQFITLVQQIRGFPRHLSQHVGGFLISSGPLYELVPVENAAMENRTVIQWDKDDLEVLELLKVDVLALGMLTAIRKSFDLILHHYGFQLSIAQISNWDDDMQVYEKIQAADTVGVFQIESRAQMSMLPRLKPKNYYDLVIQIAIVRPGPIQGKMVHPFLKRRGGLEKVEYPSKDIEDALSRTMGVPIFQEQVIKIAMVAANFTGGEADQLRRSMGKWKYNGEMEKFREQLITGMLKNGYELEFAERIFQQILGFGDYGFPESHSASFAILAYVSSWIKRYFPEVFYCGLLNSYPMGFYSPSQLIQDAQRHNIEILTPCINSSDWDHKLEQKEDSSLSIRLGLRIVKGLREETVNYIETERRNEKFKTVSQLKKHGINRQELQALASANALSTFNENRYSSRWSLLNNHDELPLFGGTIESGVYDFRPSNFDNMLEDYASLGLSLEHHPISLLRSKNLLGKYTKAIELTNKPDKTVVTVVGLVTGRQSPGSAGGVTFMTLEDDTANINVIVWLATARAQKKQFLSSKIVKVTGILERKNNVSHVIAGSIIDLTELLESLEINSRDFH